MGERDYGRARHLNVAFPHPPCSQNFFSCWWFFGDIYKSFIFILCFTLGDYVILSISEKWTNWTKSMLTWQIYQTDILTFCFLNPTLLQKLLPGNVLCLLCPLLTFYLILSSIYLKINYCCWNFLQLYKAKDFIPLIMLLHLNWKAAVAGLCFLLFNFLPFNLVQKLFLQSLDYHWAMDFYIHYQWMILNRGQSSSCKIGLSSVLSCLIWLDEDRFLLLWLLILIWY